MKLLPKIKLGHQPIRCPYSHVLPWQFPRLYWLVESTFGWSDHEFCTRHVRRARKEM